MLSKRIIIPFALTFEGIPHNDIQWCAPRKIPSVGICRNWQVGRLGSWLIWAQLVGKVIEVVIHARRSTAAASTTKDGDNGYHRCQPECATGTYMGMIPNIAEIC